MSEEKIVQFSKDQRYPEPGEPVCIVRFTHHLFCRSVVDMVSISAIKQIRMSVVWNAN